MQFSSINDLIRKLDAADFKEISLNIPIYNIRLRNEQLRDWENLLMKSAKLLPPQNETIDNHILVIKLLTFNLGS